LLNIALGDGTVLAQHTLRDGANPLRLEASMFAKDIMTGTTAVCTPHTSLRDAAALMIEHGCGCLPVAKDLDPNSAIIGMITEHDLIMRAVAEGLDPVVATVWLAMAVPAETVHDDATVEECLLRLRHQQVDRLLVVDRTGCCCGVITQGDIAKQRARPTSDDRASLSSTQIDKPICTPAARSISARLVPARESSNRLPAIHPRSSSPPGAAER